MSDTEKQRNRQLGTEKLAERVNQRIATAKAGPPARSLRILKSGDVAITLDSEEMAQQLRREDNWLQDFGEEARIAVQSYGVIIHGVNTGSLPSRDGALDRDEAIRWIKQRNDVYHQPDGLVITWAKWHRKLKEGHKTSSLTLQLPTPEQANRVKDQNLTFGQSMYTCKTYSPECRSTQCYKCWKYGHTQTNCPNTLACPLCASPHEQKDCPKDS